MTIYRPDELLALVLFATVGSFTPGPNNAIALAVGANLGWRRVLPHALGVMAGFSAMLGLAAAGAVGIVLALPGGTQLLRAGGIAYLLWLAWRVARSAPVTDPGGGPAPTAAQSALLQFVNVKAWMLVAAVASTWFLQAEHALPRVVVACVVFAALCAASILLWAGLGQSLQRWLGRGARLRVFNVAMGAVLAASALAMLR